MSVFSNLRFSLRSLFRPVWNMVWRRIEVRIRAMEVTGQVTGEAWQQHVPAFLNAVSTVGAFGHELNRSRKETLAKFATLESELTTLRDQFNTAVGRHTMPDVMRNRAGSCVARDWSVTSLPARPGIKPRVLSAEKFGQPSLRLNLGCGGVPLDGYINVDTRELPGVDLIAEAGNLPVEPGTVREIHSAHLLEHFPRDELRRRLLPYWLSLLEPGGIFNAVVPDGEAMIARFASGNYPFDALRDALFGRQNDNNDFHFDMFNPASLRDLLGEAGFVGTRVQIRARHDNSRFEFEINARRP